MKKGILTLFACALISLCLCSCEKQAPVEEPPVNNPPATEERGEPDFPENAFDTDNEVVYPDAWK